VESRLSEVGAMLDLVQWEKEAVFPQVHLWPLGPGRGRRRFSSADIARASIGPDDQFCVGYNGTGGYFLGLVLSVGKAKERFSPRGSFMLDSILAFDHAEVKDAYLGQINMITVSSFCGPQGVIWGYDVARNILPPSPWPAWELPEELEGTKIIWGERIREATRLLFGTARKRHFPLLPGSHVNCACKYKVARGPTWIYAAVGIGIPEDRAGAACLLMEDVGCLGGAKDADLDRTRSRIALDMACSVVRIGENHATRYPTVVVDVEMAWVSEREVGCALVAAPYFHIARKAYHPELPWMSLQEWYALKREHFLDRYVDVEE
jgi:histidine decarboxylase